MVNHYNVNAVADGEIVHSSDRGNLEGILREWTEARRMFPAATIRVERHSSGGKRVTLHKYTVVNGTTAAERRDRSVSEVLAAHAERMAQGAAR